MHVLNSMCKCMHFLGLVVMLGYFIQVDGVFVDTGIPYNDGPLKTGVLIITITIDKSPKHVTAYFPLERGEFAVVYFLGGLGGLAPVEFYSVFLTKLASHGFFVFGVDYAYPLKDVTGVKDDVNLQKYMENRTVGVPLWNHTGLLCHSAGCEYTLQMIEANRFPFMASAFLESFSETIHKTSSVKIAVPALMYATQLAYEHQSCNEKGFGYQKFYDAWRCPRIAMEIAEFGHCDILDPLAWEGCHVTHACLTTNNTRLDLYRQTLQGIVASFFITTIQGRQSEISYIADQSNIPLPMRVVTSDWNC